MKAIVGLLLILSTGASFAQSTFEPTRIRAQVLLLEQKLPAYNNTQISSYFPNAYDSIFNCATADELFQLTNHPNPFVRRSAFSAMLQKAMPKAFDLLTKNAGDTTQWFYVQAGNEIKKQTFADEMLYHLLLLSGWSKNFEMTAAQKATAMEMLKIRNEARQCFFSNN